MTQKHKLGATFRLLLSDFTEDEWNDLYPFAEIEADIGQGSARFDTTVTVDPDAREILVEAETVGMKIGPAELDIRILKDGQTILLPTDGIIKFSLVKTITTGATA